MSLLISFMPYSKFRPQTICPDVQTTKNRRTRRKSERSAPNHPSRFSFLRDLYQSLLFRFNYFHSALSAAIGSIIAALRAGKMPESAPTAPETATARKTAQNER